MNGYFDFHGEEAIDKKHPVVLKVKERVDLLYTEGRNTVMGDEELEYLVRDVDKEFYLVASDKNLRHHTD